MKTATLALIAAAGLSLAACSGGEKDAPEATNDTMMSNIVEPQNEAAVPAEPSPTPAPANVAREAPAAPQLSSDEQTQEDADATGMTAKVDRNASDAGQPAQ